MGFVTLMSWLTDYIDQNFDGGSDLQTGPDAHQKIAKMLFCDDTTSVMASSREELQQLVDLVCKFCEAVQMEINMDKTLFTSLNDV
jgi:hypothetical protein